MATASLEISPDHCSLSPRCTRLLPELRITAGTLSPIRRPVTVRFSSMNRYFSAADPGAGRFASAVAFWGALPERASRGERHLASPR
jgi:hypothetical protein